MNQEILTERDLEQLLETGPAVIRFVHVEDTEMAETRLLWIIPEAPKYLYWDGLSLYALVAFNSEQDTTPNHDAENERRQNIAQMRNLTVAVNYAAGLGYVPCYG